jgi:hypothetical protein
MVGVVVVVVVVVRVSLAFASSVFRPPPMRVSSSL